MEPHSTVSLLQNITLTFYCELTDIRLRPSGQQIDPNDEEGHTNNCLVAIGRLQVTSSPNCVDISGQNSSTEFISRHSIDGKFTFIDQRYTE